MSDYDILLKEYRQLAKRADQRLVRIEGYRHDKGFRSATRYAYGSAMKDIQKWSGPNAKRFNTKAPGSEAALKRKIQDIKNFLEKETSTKRGITKVYKKKADTINKMYGTQFTWEDLAKYYLSGTAEKLNSEYGSDTALRAIAEIQKTDKNIINSIKSESDKHVTVSDDIIVDDVITGILTDNNLDISMLF